MKKLLLLLVLVMSFFLISCDNVETTEYNYSQDIENLETDIQADIADLEFQIAVLEERLDNLISVSGLNGQTVYYEQTIVKLKAQVSELYAGNFNTNLAPSYMYDESGDYVEFSELGSLLKIKYFSDIDDSSLSDIYEMIPYAHFVYRFDTVDTVDFNLVVARVILMVQELSKYEYYSLSSNGIKITISWVGDHSHNLTFDIPTVVIINDMFDLNFESIIGNEFESRFESSESYDNIDYDTVKTYYDGYVMNGTYDGYVLNYTE